MSIAGAATFASFGFQGRSVASFARFLAPVVILLALPLAVVAFALMLGGAAALAAVTSMRRHWSGRRRRPAPGVIEGEYVVIDEGRPRRRADRA